jgi:hypothetical protein
MQVFMFRLMPWPHLPADYVENIELFAKEVMPHLQANDDRAI